MFIPKITTGSDSNSSTIDTPMSDNSGPQTGHHDAKNVRTITLPA